MNKQNAKLGLDQFRKDAVRQRQKGDQFDRLLIFVGIKGWMSLVAITLVLGAAIYWMLIASIPERVSGHGILLPSRGLTTLNAPCSGVISEVLMLEGDTLEPGDCLARIDTAATGTAPRRILCSFRARLEAVQVQPGDQVQTGDVLFTLDSISRTNPGLHAILYFSPGDGQRIQAGMCASLDPVSTDPEDYGYLLGHVASVSQFPMTTAEIARLIDNEDLAREWTADGPLIQIFVTLIPDTQTVSGYQWSSRTGPNMTIHAGSLCAGEVTLSERKPIELILPDISGQSKP